MILFARVSCKNIYDFDKNQSCQYQFLLLLLAKSADVSTLDTPLLLMSATVSIFQTPPPPLKMLTYFMDGP